MFCFRSLNPLSVTASQNLRKLYTQIQLCSKEDKKIPVKAVTKLLAGSKEDRRLVERALDQSGLPCGKTDEISRKEVARPNPVGVSGLKLFLY